MLRGALDLQLAYIFKLLAREFHPMSRFFGQEMERRRRSRSGLEVGCNWVEVKLGLSQYWARPC